MDEGDFKDTMNVQDRIASYEARTSNQKFGACLDVTKESMGVHQGRMMQIQT